MALDADVLAVLRSWVGETPDDATLEAKFDRLGSVAAVVLEVLRERRAALLAGPIEWTTEDGYRENNKENLKALDALISDVIGGAVGDPVARVTRTQLTRPEYQR